MEELDSNVQGQQEKDGGCGRTRQRSRWTGFVVVNVTAVIRITIIPQRS